LLWSQGGAVWGAFANGANVSQPTVLTVGALSDYTETTLTDGNILLTWVNPTSAGKSEMWAEVFNPSSFQWSRELLGLGDGNLHVVALASGGFAASWQDGTQIDARAYDGHGDYGPQTTVLGQFLGLDAAGDVVTVYSDASGHALMQHYHVTADPFASG
jgi:hypothetical protein